RRDLDGAEHAAVEDPDVDLGAGDEALDDRGVVVLEGDLEGAAELRGRRRPGDAEARSLAARLDDHRVAERAVDRLEIRRIEARIDGVVRRRGDVVEAEQLLGLE